jgi:hypothetical protein
MNRRLFLRGVASILPAAPLLNMGCRGHQTAHVLSQNDKDMVGSHNAGAETWKPLVNEATCKLLARQHSVIQAVSHEGQPMLVESPKKSICFAGVENKSIEELGDFREQIYECIDTIVNESEEFVCINKRFVDAGLRECRLRPDDLFLPNNRRMFASVLEKNGQPFDYLLFAKVTSGTTQSNKDYQRDYKLTLDLVNIENGDADKESADLSKGYHKTKLGKIRNYGV